MFQGTRQLVVALVLIAAVVCFLPVAANESDERIDKLEREVQALKEALALASAKAGEAEGDRFGEIEAGLSAEGRSLEEADLGEMERRWQLAKVRSRLA